MYVNSNENFNINIKKERKEEKRDRELRETRDSEKAKKTDTQIEIFFLVF